LASASGAVLPSSSNDRRKGNHLEISVYDTGNGMNADDVQHLMKRHSKDHAASGFGLGLDIVKQISDQLGLGFQIYSKFGRGTHARFLIPCSV